MSAVALAASPHPAEPAKVAGEWNVVLELAAIRGQPKLVLKQDGEKVNGVYVGRYGESPLEGTVKEKNIEFTVRLNAEGTQTSGYFVGVVDGDKMGGTVEFEGAGEGTWTATRAAAKN
jgi:hypothetical protein